MGAFDFANPFSVLSSNLSNDAKSGGIGTWRGNQPTVGGSNPYAPPPAKNPYQHAPARPGGNAPASTFTQGGYGGKPATPGAPGPLSGMFQQGPFGKGTGPSAAPYGTQSGPTAVEDRYNTRANGTDPGWEYATGRATDAINKQYTARGGYNSSGAMQSIGDMFSNATSQREGQLDTLANEATGAHQNALNSMFTAGLGIANGSSAAGQPYGVAGGGAQSDAMRAQIDLMLSKAGVDQKTRQGELDAIFGAAKTGAAIAGA